MTYLCGEQNPNPDLKKYATNSFLTPEKTLPRGASFRAKSIALSPAGA